MRPFTYTKATTAADAVRAVATGGPETRFIAGGTTLYDLMKLDVETPTSVVVRSTATGTRPRISLMKRSRRPSRSESS